ncbi:MAG: hypothetical protein R3D32_13030 [Nitratireductor sp.]
MFRGRSAYFRLLAATVMIVFLALVFLSPIGNAVFVVLAISVIGIPVALALSLIPPVALLLSFASIFAWPMRKHGWVAVLLAFIPAAAAMFFIPVGMNIIAEREAQDLVSGDIAPVTAPFAGRTLALLVRPGHREECFNLCQRALVSGAAQTFIVASMKKTWPNPDFGAEGTAYWLERREKCEPVKLRGEASEFPRSVDRQDPSPALRLLVAGGQCLVSSRRLVADADAVLQFAEMVEGRSNRNSLDPFHVPMRAVRLSWNVREGTRFRELIRQTAVDYSVLSSPLMPALLGGAELRMHAGLQRKRRKAGFAFDEVDVETLLRERLKIDLSFDANAATRTRDAVVDAALRSGASLSATQQSLIGDMFLELGEKGQEINPANVEKAVSLIEDQRVELPDQLERLVRAAYKSEPATRERVLSALFVRLDAIAQHVPADKRRERSAQLRILTRAVSAIPDTDFARNWPRLRMVLADPEATSIFSDEVRRSRLAGAAAHDDLIALVDAASPLAGEEIRRNKFLRGNRFIAMATICRMGRDAAGLLPVIEDRVRRGVLPLADSSDLLLVATTLQGLGGNPGMIRDHAESGSSQKNFAETVEKTLLEVAKRKRCY